MFSLNVCAEEPDKSLITVHHAMEVIISPHSQTLRVKDTITLPDNTAQNLVFSLHKGMNPRAVTSGVYLSPADNRRSDNLLYERYAVAVPDGVDSFTIEYQGRIFHQIMSHG